MELLFILSVVVLFVPLTLSILRSLRLLGTQPRAYYDFTVLLRNTKPWTVALYLVIIIALSFVVLLLAGVPLVKLPA